MEVSSPLCNPVHVIIDMTGTSIGAFVGGLYAKEGDYVSAAGRVKQFSGRMGNIWRILSDVTYPIVAYTTVSYRRRSQESRVLIFNQGHEFNRAIYKVGSMHSVTSTCCQNGSLLNVGIP